MSPVQKLENGAQALILDSEVYRLCRSCQRMLDIPRVIKPFTGEADADVGFSMHTVILSSHQL
jgi:hypothetical protein